MKKNSMTIILGVILLVSIVVNLSQLGQQRTVNTELVKAQEQIDMAGNEIKVLESDLKKLLDESTKREEELVESKSLLIESREELIVVNTQLSAINKKLNTSYNPLQKIDTLLLENERWKEELNIATSKLAELKGQTRESENEVKNDNQEDMANSLINEFEEAKNIWDQDIDNIKSLLSKRINELESLSTSLPALSLEKVMIGTEIDFLNDLIDDLVKLQSS